MLGFGMFVVALLALVVELIKNQQKNITSIFFAYWLRCRCLHTCMY
ncbi:putative holin-like toxin [Lacticaseibacillus paracasei]